METYALGAIGCGHRLRWMIKMVTELGMGVRLAAVADVSEKEALWTACKEDGLCMDGVRYYADADAMLENEKLAGVMVGTRCSKHTEMAVKALNKNLPLFLEKPVSTSYEQMALLKKAGERSKAPVVVSFPLRETIHARTVKRLLREGEIGEIMHVAAFNYVPYGGDYYHAWYRDEGETGGLWLQKATHDFDYITDIVGLKPVEICAMNAKKIMKGDKPEGLLCADCAERFRCKEGPFEIVHTTLDRVHGPYCCFAKDTGNEDSGSAIIRYENGMHAVYTQNFFIRNKATARRGAIFSGTEATVEFDWVSNKLKLTRHYDPGVAIYDFPEEGQHGGGDFQLVVNFARILRGEEESRFPLEAGLLSVYMCLKARDSSAEHRFEGLDEAAWKLRKLK